MISMESWCSRWKLCKDRKWFSVFLWKGAPVRNNNCGICHQVQSFQRLSWELCVLHPFVKKFNRAPGSVHYSDFCPMHNVTDVPPCHITLLWEIMVMIIIISIMIMIISYHHDDMSRSNTYVLNHADQHHQHQNMTDVTPSAYCNTGGSLEGLNGLECQSIKQNLFFLQKNPF